MTPGPAKSSGQKFTQTLVDQRPVYDNERRRKRKKLKAPGQISPRYL